MNNDINESNNNNTPEKKKNGKNSPGYTINIFKSIENENFKEMPGSPTNKSIKNRLCLSPIRARRKSKNEIEKKNLLRKSFMPKNITFLEPGKNEKDKIINKTKTIKSNKKQNIYLRECKSISPRRKKRMKDNINNNYNNDETSNIFKFTNQLFENDEHLTKLLVKKNDINSPKKKLIIKFGLEDNMSINKLYKKKVSNIFKKKESYDITKGTDKRSFTNFVKMRTAYSPKKEREDYINKTIRNSNQNMLSNYIEFSNKNNKDGDCTTKSVKFCTKSKTVKNKNMNVPEKSLLNENENDNMTNKKKNKKRGSINSIKIPTNFCDIPKKKKIKNKNNSKTKSKNKKKLFCLFSCLNSKQNDSDEV